MIFRIIDTKFNPYYRFDIFTDDLNYNFAQISGSSGGNFFSGGTVTGNTIFTARLSASTLYSGSTNLYDIFSTADTNDITRIQPGTNILTGGTGNAPVINLSSDPVINSLELNDLIVDSSITLLGSDIFGLFAPFGTPGDITRIKPGTNITTGGTGNAPTVNVTDSPSFNIITASGTSQLSGAVIQNLSANTLSYFTSNSFTTNANNGLFSTFTATTYYSGNTTLAQAILNLNDGNDITRVKPGANISTGGTGNNPIINLIANPSVNNLSASGLSQFNNVIITNFSGSSLYISASTTSSASIRISSGGTVVSPNDGDIWNDGLRLYSKIGGLNKKLDNIGIDDWVIVTGNSQTVSVNIGYLNYSTGTTIFTLPAFSQIGDMVEIVGTDSGIWQVNQLAGQIIKISGNSTTIGNTGNLISTSNNDSISMICVSANTKWIVKSLVGNPQIN